jgi:hypothetical protein
MCMHVGTMPQSRQLERLTASWQGLPRLCAVHSIDVSIAWHWPRPKHGGAQLHAEIDLCCVALKDTNSSLLHKAGMHCARQNKHASLDAILWSKGPLHFSLALACPK